MITEAKDMPEKTEQATPETETQTKCVEIDPESATGKSLMLIAQAARNNEEKAIYQQGRADALETALKISHHWNEIQSDQPECECEACKEDQEPEPVELAMAMDSAMKEAQDKRISKNVVDHGDQVLMLAEGKLILAKYLLEHFHITRK